MRIARRTSSLRALCALVGLWLAGCRTGPDEGPAPGLYERREISGPPRDLVVAADGSEEFERVEVAVASARAGDRVLIRAGEYEISPADEFGTFLEPAAGVSIIGESPLTTVLRAAPEGGYEFNTLVHLVGDGRVRIENLTLECGYACIYLHSSPGVAVVNCVLRGGGHHGMEALVVTGGDYASSDLRLENVAFVDCGEPVRIEAGSGGVAGPLHFVDCEGGGYSLEKTSRAFAEGWTMGDVHVVDSPSVSSHLAGARPVPRGDWDASLRDVRAEWEIRGPEEPLPGPVAVPMESGAGEVGPEGVASRIPPESPVASAGGGAGASPSPSRPGTSTSPAPPSPPRYPPAVFFREPRGDVTTSRPTVRIAAQARSIEAGVLLESVRVLVDGREVPWNDPGVKDLVVRSRLGRSATRVEVSAHVPLDGPGEHLVEIVARDVRGAEGREAIRVVRDIAKGRFAAVVIGVGRYRDPRVSRLEYCDEDAIAFRDYLVQRVGVPGDRVRLLVDEDATLPGIRRALGDWLPRQVGVDDTAVIYFSGHGAVEEDRESKDGDGLSKYLLPVGGDPDSLYATAFPMDEFGRIFARTRARKVILFADCCYSGSAGGRTMPRPGGTRSVRLSEEFLERIAGGEGRAIFTASGPNELSREDDRFRHGVFTYHLLEALRGGADENGDGWVSLSEVHPWVRRRVIESTGRRQTPVFRGEIAGEIVLGAVEESAAE